MYSSVLSQLLLLQSSLYLVSAAPAPLEPRQTPVAPASGFRGGPDLLGYSPGEVLTTENTHVAGFKLEPGQQQDANIGSYVDLTKNPKPQPIRGSKGGTDPGPYSGIYEPANSDKYAPPGTDHGSTINAEWPMGLSHAKLGLKGAGWSKQQNIDVMPAAKAMAGVMMRLEANGYRELHWHVAAEWALMLNGTARIQAINENGETFVDDVSKGDVWFFPAGVPHSIQALGGGTEFLLIFDDGNFSEDNTFLASEIFAHNPKEVLAKTLGVDVEAFKDIPSGELFIFPGTPAPKDIKAQNITGSAGVLPKNETYSYHFSMQKAVEVPGGTVKIVDPRSFPIAQKFSAALVTIKPNAVREIHWHPTSDEWTFFISGQGRATLFTPPRSANTFDYHAGDVGYFPKSNSHYIENTGTEDLVVLEVLQADHFSDISLGQWLGLTPPQIVKDTLNLSDATVAKLKKEKQYIVAG